MTSPEVSALISRVSMRGMKFEYVQTFQMTYILTAHSIVRDSENENRLHHGHCSCEFSDIEFMDSEDIIKMLHRLVLGFYQHEADELFLVDGKAIFNPHKIKKEELNNVAA